MKLNKPGALTGASDIYNEQDTSFRRQAEANAKQEALIKELEGKQQPAPAVDDLMKQLNRPMDNVVTPTKDLSLEELNSAAEREVKNKYIINEQGEAVLPSDELIAEERNRQNVLAPRGPSEFGNVLGDINDVGQFTVNVNERNKELYDLQAQNQITRVSTQQRSDLSYADREPIKQELKTYTGTDFSDLRSRVTFLRDKFNTDNVSVYQNKNTNTYLTPLDVINTKYSGYIDNSPNKNKALDDIAVAYEFATFQVLNNLAKFGLRDQDARESDTVELNDPDDYEAQLMASMLQEGYGDTLETETKLPDIGNIVDKDIFGIKSEISEEYANDPTAIQKYRHMQSVARSIDGFAQNLLTRQGIDPNREDKGSDIALAEYALQNAIDYSDVNGKPLAQLRGYVNKKDGKEYFFPYLTREGFEYSNLINDLSFIMNPQTDTTNLGQLTPPTLMGELGANALRERKKALSKPGQEPIPDDQAKNLLEQVGRTVESRYWGIIKELFDIGKPVDEEVVNEATKLAKLYFKLDDANLESTRERTYREKKAELTTAVKKGFMNLTPEQIEGRAKSYSENQVEQARGTGWQMQANRIGMLLDRINDVNTDGQQKIKYSRWLISKINHRMQEISSDMQSQDKAITRSIDNFANKGYITVNPEADAAYERGLAKQLYTALNRDSGASRQGMDTIRLLNNLGNDVVEEMGAKIMFATLYLKLAKEGIVPRIEHTFFDGSVTDPTKLKTKDMGKRMEDPSQYLKFFADNRDTILNALDSIGMITNNLGTGQLSVTDFINKQPALAKVVLERGELGYYLSVLEDAVAYKAAKEGRGPRRFQLKGYTELDSSNSNIIIQTLLSGNPKMDGVPNAAATLGAFIGIGEPEIQEMWRDTFDNPASFYDILSDNYSNLIREHISDKDKQDALGRFFSSVINEGLGKDITRSIVIAGFYGLHPSVNDAAIIEFLNTTRDKQGNSFENILINEASPYKDLTSAVEDIKLLQGANFNKVFGKLSMSFVSKRLGAFSTLNGELAPNFKSPTGGLIGFERLELAPEFGEYLDANDPEEDGAYGRRKVVNYKGRDGRDQLSLVKRNSFTDGKGQYSVNSQGELENTSKLDGFAYADGVAAVMTQMYDSNILKLALLAANTDSAIAMPIITIHDALKVNAKSYLHAWVGYNRVALPGLVKQKNFLEMQYEHALEVIKSLKKESANALKANMKTGKGGVYIGTSHAGKFRTLPALLDYVYKNNKEPQPTDSSFKKKKYKRTKALLDAAAKLGWIPNDISHPKTLRLKEQGKDITAERANLVIPAVNFNMLIDILADLYEVKRIPKALTNTKVFKEVGFEEMLSPDTIVEKRIDTDRKGKNQLAKYIDSGNYKINNANEF